MNLGEENWLEVGFLRPSFIMEVYGKISFSCLLLKETNQIKWKLDNYIIETMTFPAMSHMTWGKVSDLSYWGIKSSNFDKS